MILSHRHRFIFLKTKKTAGTSVELALSQVCGPDDVVTPIAGKVDVRNAGHVPRNYDIAPGLRPWFWRFKKLWGADDRHAGLCYWNHMTAEQVRNRAGAKTFDAYRKVSVERNPWDREVSYYFWLYKKADRRPSFEEFVLTDKWRKPVNNFEIYSLKSRIVADVVMRYERLSEDFSAFVGDLGIADPPVLPHAKTGVRPEGSGDYRSFYTDETREAVGRIYAREIAAFGYTF
ncbi:hypothetical protein GGD81_000589 [Rhodobium orientis]|uniref:sulfotransferase family 2 domain-containing protein n=1 Tax=Rhodobium orientis TaxID=34017 RepID=UPI000DAECF7B|nr:sulfotransferase family 2 domain-containing protein [Rhodobium orientis]MBB4301572.1 hypothetical protein [Rhodobium orientis]